MRLVKIFLLIVLALIIVPAALMAQEAEDEEPTTVEDGSTEQDKPVFRLVWPDFEWDGGAWEYYGGRWFFPYLPEWRSARKGLWLGGRMSWYTLPLSERLDPITEEVMVDSFDDGLMMIGPVLTFSVEDTLWLSVYFDTGYQSIEEGAGSDRRKTEVNVTRIGIRPMVTKPLGYYLGEPDLPRPDFLKEWPLMPGSIRAGMALDIGFGNLNAFKKYESFFIDRTVNMPFFYLTPCLVMQAPWTDYFAIDLSAGYSIVTTSSFSTEFYFDDKDMVKGTDLNGWIFSMEVVFGTGSIKSLLPQQVDDEG